MTGKCKHGIERDECSQCFNELQIPVDAYFAERARAIELLQSWIDEAPNDQQAKDLQRLKAELKQQHTQIVELDCTEKSEAFADMEMRLGVALQQLAECQVENKRLNDALDIMQKMRPLPTAEDNQEN